MPTETPLLFSQAYRPLFPLAALSSAVSVLLWLCGLSGFLPMPPNPTLWHAHEMLFGFATAVILGFVLTAVVNWTGRAACNPRSLGVLVGLWLCARLAGYWPSREGQMLSAVFDIVVLPLGTVMLGRVLIASGNQRNLAFIPLLSTLALFNLGFHLALYGDAIALARALTQLTVWSVALLLIFMGGRVIPFFSGRRLRYVPRQWATLNWLSTLAALATVCSVAWAGMGSITAACAGLASAATGLRLLFWRPWRSYREPMLWILHLGYLWLVVGYALLAVTAANLIDLRPSTPVHAVMAGALGCLSLGMMTRVALGHSDRKIRADSLDILSFVLVLAAGLCRLAADLPGPLLGLPGLTISALLWSGAFLLYGVIFLPRMARPAPVPRPG